MILDLTKCHDPGPDYMASLAYYEEATVGLEKRMTNICNILLEKKELAKKDAELSERLIEEFEFFTRNELNPKKEIDANIQASLEMMTQSLRQLIENRERYMDQLDIGIVKPLNQFLSTEFGQVNITKKAFHKSHSKVNHLVEKLCQTKKQDISALTELSMQLFDGRAYFHKVSCQYALELINLHKKKRPELIEILLNLMMYDCSYFHLGHVMLKDVELQVNDIYKTSEQIRSSVISSDSERKVKATNILEQWQAIQPAIHARIGALKYLEWLQISGECRMLISRGQDLVAFHYNDLQLPQNVALKHVMGHLRRVHKTLNVEEKDIKPSSTPQSHITKGYLYYAEPRTFGTSWIRLYFYIKNGQLLSQESTKLKSPICLNLSLCNAKEVSINEAERHFCFRVTSPVRILLLQAESTKEMSQWIEALNVAITSSLHKEEDPSSSPSAPEKKTVRLNSIDALKELYAIEGNDVCADCGADKPKWTCVVHGILVCIECSGAHRSMGVYVSQVRSLTLDTLKPEWLEKIKQVGNRQSNAVYEALLPKDFDREAIKKFEKRNEFIINKYKELKFTRPEDAEMILEERERRRSRHIKPGASATNSNDKESSVNTEAVSDHTTNTSVDNPNDATSNTTTELTEDNSEQKQTEEQVKTDT